MADAILAASYSHCRRIARTAARNFYYGFLLLPESKRDALCALYAFMRRVDDLSDTPGAVAEKQKGLAEWRAAMDRALDGASEADPVWPAFRHTVSFHGIPARYFHDVISGAEMDLSITSYATFDRLREYCYRVAGAVGLACLYVFGFSDPRAPDRAEHLGIAFQLTNILRDLPRDYEMGRVYLPQEDLERFGCRPEDLARRTGNPAFYDLMACEAGRAWEFYREGWQLLPLVSADSRAALWALARIYSGILEDIEARDYDVFSARAGLSIPAKLWILLRARLGARAETYASQKRAGDRRRAGGPSLRRRAG
jgi:phytoene synthase